MAIDGFSFNTIDNSRVDPNSPIDTTLMTDLRDALEFLQRWLGKTFLGAAVADHNHDGVNSALTQSPMSLNMVLVSWEGNGSVTEREIQHHPIKKDLGIIVLNDDATEDAGFINIKEAVPQVDSVSVTRWANQIEDNIFDVNTATNYPNGLHIQASNEWNASGISYTALLMKEIEGLVAIGTYDGTGVAQTIDISTTSDNGIADFQPDFVWVWRTNATNIGGVIRTEDHASTNSQNAESGNQLSDDIIALVSNGFNVGAGVLANASGGEFRYLAVKKGSAGGVTIEKVTSPQDGTEQYVSLTTITDTPVLALAIRTDASDTTGVHVHLLNARPLNDGLDRELGLQIDASDEDWTDGIIALANGEIKVGAVFPNLATDVSNIWAFSSSPMPIYSEVRTT